MTMRISCSLHEAAKVQHLQAWPFFSAQEVFKADVSFLEQTMGSKIKPDKVGETYLNYREKELHEIEDLRHMSSLQKLDLSGNKLSDLKGIAHNKELTWLNVSYNKVEKFHTFKRLKKLSVVNASHNLLSSVNGFSSLHSLKALILNNNNITSVQELETLSELNSLVLSHNQLKSITTSRFPQLVKLCLSHNQLKECPDVQANPKLKEIRLNGNKISSIPSSFQACKYLQLMDLGNNDIRLFSSVNALKDLKFLVNLNLKGNPICSESSYESKVLRLVPSLKVLDGQKVTDEIRNVAVGIKESTYDESSKSKKKRSEKKETNIIKYVAEEGKEIKKSSREPEKKTNLPQVAKVELYSKASLEGSYVDTAVKLNSFTNASKNNPDLLVNLGDTSSTRLMSTDTVCVRLKRDGDPSKKEENKEKKKERKKVEQKETTAQRTSEKDVKCNENEQSSVFVSTNIKSPSSEAETSLDNLTSKEKNIAVETAPDRKNCKSKLRRKSDKTAYITEGIGTDAKKRKSEKIDPRSGILSVKKVRKRSKTQSDNVQTLLGSHTFEFGTGKEVSWFH